MRAAVSMEQQGGNVTLLIRESLFKSVPVPVLMVTVHHPVGSASNDGERGKHASNNDSDRFGTPEGR